MPKRLNRVALLLATSALIAPAAHAATQCSPLEPGAKILASTNTRDIHKEWKGENSIGTSWSLVNVSQQGDFLSGYLMSPRGGKQPYRVYVIRSEWDCE